MNIQVKEIRPGVLHATFDNRYDLTSTFMRLQEFYESPFREIKGKFFKHEKYMDKYAKENDGFSYYEDWEGFNVPGNVVMNFESLFRHDFWEKEKLLFNAIKKAKISSRMKTGRFYLIGTERTSPKKLDEVIAHELAHAYFYLYRNYRMEISELVKEMNHEEFDILKEGIIDKGYSHRFVLDEVQAYCTTSSPFSIAMTIDINESVKIPRKLKSYFKKFDAKQKGLLKG